MFHEVSGAAVVTSRVKVAEATAQVNTQVDTHVTPQVTPQVGRILEAAAHGAKTRMELQKSVGIRDREHFRKVYLKSLLNAGWLERTIPSKPHSRMQRYSSMGNSSQRRT